MAVFEKRKTKDGKIKYRAKVRIKGHPQQSKTFKRLTDAKRWADQLEVDLQQGIITPRVKKQKHTLAELVDRYIENCLSQKSPSTQEAQLRHLEWWKSNLGSYFLVNITAPLLVEYREKIGNEIVRGKKRSPSTRNRFMSALSHAFSVAWREWEWMEENPIRKIAKLKEPSGNTRYLSEAEQNRLLAECKNSKASYLHLIVLLGLSTGMRLNEIRSLRWTQVDLKNGIFRILATKNKRPRQVPVQGQALIKLKTHSKIRRINSDLVFPSPRNPKIPVDIRRAWENARDRAGLTDFRFHDLRHTAASYYAMSGASARDLCEIFGWETIQMAMRYAHLSECHTSELAVKMSKKFIN